MKISFIGSRGIPAKYGGFEVFAEQISTRLVERNYNVIVCCEYKPGEKSDEFRGVHLEYLPFPPPKIYFLRKFYEVLVDIYFMIVLAKRCDIMYIMGPIFIIIIPIFINKNLKVLINVGGLEWKREKWNRIEKILLRLNNLLCVKFADIVVIDSKCMEKYISKNYRHKTVFIPYGADISENVGWDKARLNCLSEKSSRILEIEKNSYWLGIARIEPDNNIHMVLEGFLKSNSKLPLVVVGDYTSERYKAKLSKILDEDKNARIIMAGPIYEDRLLLNMLRDNCFAYMHAHSSGGTNPSLLEAMASSNIILAHDNEFNREVCAESACYFKNADDLAEKIRLIEKDIINFLQLQNQACERVGTNYSWEKIVNEYIGLFKRIKNNYL